VSTFSDWRDAQAALLSMSGWTVTIDPATVNPPCAVVGPIESITTAGNTNWDIEASVWLVHPAPGGAVAFDWLEGNLPAFLSQMSPFADCELTTYPHPSGDLPAYRVAIRTTIPNTS
jgi:hypothetical protein